MFDFIEELAEWNPLISKVLKSLESRGMGSYEVSSKVTDAGIPGPC